MSERKKEDLDQIELELVRDMNTRSSRKNEKSKLYNRGVSFFS